MEECPQRDGLSPMTPAVRRALFQAMERLPATERRLLTLRFVKGWTVSRIARHLGLDRSHLPPPGAHLSHDESRDRDDAAEGRVSHGDDGEAMRTSVAS